MQKILMCAPDHFGVNYVINPWMEGHRGNTDAPLAQRQWQQLKQVLAAKVELAFVQPQPKLPDLVFTANAGFVMGKTVVVTRFSSPERQGEEPFFRDWFAANGFTLADWPDEVKFEGAGDALLDRGAPIIWAAHGFRSQQAAAPLLEKIYGRETLSLRLVDPRFYHLDTCFCPLEGGYLMYFPSAFDDASQRLIAARVPENKRIIVPEPDAIQFACNAVDLDHHLFLNAVSPELQAGLSAVGFTTVVVPLAEYLKSGGAAKCLTLKLHEV